MRLTTLLVALLFIGALQLPLPCRVQPTKPTTSDFEFQGATQFCVMPRDWCNPILVVDALGVTLVERPGSLQRWIPSFDIDTLKGVVSDLPATAWPQGRTVFFDTPPKHAVAGKGVPENTRRVIAVLARLHMNFTIVTITTGC